MRRTLCLTIVTWLSIVSGGGAQDSIWARLDGEIADTIERVRPLVVHITAQTQTGLRVVTPDGVQPERVARYMSGVLLDDQGYIATITTRSLDSDFLVVEAREGETVEKALWVGRDRNTGISVLKASPRKVEALELIKPARLVGLREGFFGLVLGHGRDDDAPRFRFGPFTSLSMTAEFGGIEQRDLLALSAPCREMDRGGAVVGGGSVVGMVLGCLSDGPDNSALTLVYRIERVRMVADELIRKAGRPEFTKALSGRPWIGIRGRDVDDDLISRQLGLGRNEGIIIEGVVDDGAAKAAGLRAMDIVTEWDGKPLYGIADLANRVSRQKVGDKVQLTIVRQGVRKTLVLKIGAF